MSDDKPSKRVVIRANRVQTEILKEAYTQSQTANAKQLDILFDRTGLPKKWITNWFIRQRKKNRVKQEDVCSFKAEFQEPALDTVTPPQKLVQKRTKKGTPAKQLVIPKLEYPDENEIQLLSSPLSVAKTFHAYNEPLGSSPSTAASANHSSMSAPTPVSTTSLNASADFNQSPWIPPSTEQSYMPYQPQSLSSPWLFDGKENSLPDYMRAQPADCTFNTNIPSSVLCAMPYAQASTMQMQESSFMTQLPFPLHYSYPPASSSMEDTLNPQLTPLKHLSVLANQNYPNDTNILSACLLDEQFGQNDPFQAAMGLVYMSRLGLNW